MVRTFTDYYQYLEKKNETIQQLIECQVAVNVRNLNSSNVVRWKSRLEEKVSFVDATYIKTLITKYGDIM